MQRLFKQFCFPGGIPSHVAPETPGSIHEGGELGYSLSHAFGAAFDNPDLIVACVVGDGEAETGPLATSWHSQQIPQPGDRRRGAADPAPERLQDRQSDDPGAHRAGGAEQPVRRLRLQAVSGRGRRSRDHASADGGDARPGLRRDRRDPEARRAHGQGERPADLADDHPEDAQGLDRAEGGRRPEDGGLLALASGAVRRDRDQARASEAARSNG